LAAKINLFAGVATVSFPTTETSHQNRTLFDYLLHTLAGSAIALVSCSFLLWLSL
jgi:hypothetical protein